MLQETKKQKAQVGIYDENLGIKCTTSSIIRGLLSCGGLIISVYMVVCFIVTAVSVFWSSRSIYTIVSGETPIIMTIRS